MSSLAPNSSSTRRSYLRGVAAAGGVSIAGLAGCIDMILDDDPIAVGVLTDHSGVLQGIAKGWEASLRLAVDEINAAGGPLDRQLELHYADTEGDREVAVDAYTELVQNHHITTVFGPPSGLIQTDELAEAITDTEVMQVLTGVEPRIADQGFTTVDDRELKLVGRTITNFGQLGVSAAYVLNEILDADTAWLGWWETLEREMLTLTEELFDGDTVGWYERLFHGKTTFPELVEADPDAFVYFGLDQELTLMALEEDGYDGDVIFHRGFDQTDLDEYGALADGVYSVEGRTEPTDGTDDFWEAIASEADGDQDGILPEAYDAVYLVALALQQAGENSGPAISEQIRGVSTSPGTEVTVGEFEDAKAMLEDGGSVHYIGASGHVDLNERLEPVYPQAVMQVQAGEAVDVETLSADFFEGKLYDR